MRICAAPGLVKTGKANRIPIGVQDFQSVINGLKLSMLLMIDMIININY